MQQTLVPTQKYPLENNNTKPEYYYFLLEGWVFLCHYFIFSG